MLMKYIVLITMFVVICVPTVFAVETNIEATAVMRVAIGLSDNIEETLKNAIFAEEAGFFEYSLTCDRQSCEFFIK